MKTVKLFFVSIITIFMTTSCQSQNKNDMTNFQKAQEIQQKIIRGDLLIGILDIKEVDVMINLYTELRDANSWYELGMIYYRGIGVEQNAEKATYFFQLAAESDYGIEAWIKYIRVAYFANLVTIPSNKIITLVEKLEEIDTTGEIYLLKGYMLYKGYAYDKNLEASFFMHQKSAKKGNAEAMLDLSIYYTRGIGVEIDIEKAISWCIRAAENNNPRAMYNLGTYYAKGFGNISKDINKTISYYTKAANWGHGKAAGQLAVMYTMGDEIDKNEELAKKFYKLAIENYFEVDFLFEELGLKDIDIDE